MKEARGPWFAPLPNNSYVFAYPPSEDGKMRLHRRLGVCAFGLALVALTANSTRAQTAQDCEKALAFWTKRLTHIQQRITHLTLVEAQNEGAGLDAQLAELAERLTEAQIQAGLDITAACGG